MRAGTRAHVCAARGRAKTPSWLWPGAMSETRKLAAILRALSVTVDSPGRTNPGAPLAALGEPPLMTSGEPARSDGVTGLCELATAGCKMDP
jgi:hypothetical protein